MVPASKSALEVWSHRPYTPDVIPVTLTVRVVNIEPPAGEVILTEGVAVVMNADPEVIRTTRPITSRRLSNMGVKWPEGYL
jgi:hypothetical protein